MVRVKERLNGKDRESKRNTQWGILPIKKNR